MRPGLYAHPLTVLTAAGVLAGGAALAAPPVARGNAGAPALQEFPEVPYDGRFTFVRIYYDTGRGSGLAGFGRRGGREPLWAHDYPRAETNFAKILDETTYLDPYMGGSRILAMDDPEIFKYPVIYIVEVGFWRATDAEVDALSRYLAKGGFLIVDDFRDRQIWNIEEILTRAAPGLSLQRVPHDHPIFDAFFRIEDPQALIPPYGGGTPVYLGLFEDNDPRGRLMAILNYNMDIAEYWEYSDYGYLPIDLSNEAYKFGVNYMMYALTH